MVCVCMYAWVLMCTHVKVILVIYITKCDLHFSVREQETRDMSPPRFQKGPSQLFSEL